MTVQICHIMPDAALLRDFCDSFPDLGQVSFTEDSGKKR
ncbi:unnamed protein product [Anisakis simplex]|uniref:RRM domain-containing protein n=1 Tax=Anisakis simplex TaxID=6269 RepID=A0A0M3JMC9_ANISI|nr:unnamed protein product [Anisakis simplex]